MAAPGFLLAGEYRRILPGTLGRGIAGTRDLQHRRIARGGGNGCQLAGFVDDARLAARVGQFSKLSHPTIARCCKLCYNRWRK